MFYIKKDNGSVECTLCPHNCMIVQSKVGKCKVRKNIKGILYSLNYSLLCAKSIDPIEKKPIFHLLPGSSSLSIATMGCNLSCKFCQNSEISQITQDLDGFNVKPSQVVEDALASGCRSIAYTYTEPTVFFEMCIDTAKIAKEKKLKNILVTNGFTNVEPIKRIAPYIDAVNIDLKSMDESFYNEQAGAALTPVLDSIRLYHKLGILVEITTLIIPGFNDSHEELDKAASVIASVDKNIPWHLSAFYPMYKMQSISPTPLETLEKAFDIAKKQGLNFVYVGNIPSTKYQSTYCPSCNKVVIKRDNYLVTSLIDKKNTCPHCGFKLNLIVK